MSPCILRADNRNIPTSPRHSRSSFRPEDGTHIRRQCPQAPATAGNAAPAPRIWVRPRISEPMQNASTPAGRRAQMRMVQDEPPVGPFGGPS